MVVAAKTGSRWARRHAAPPGRRETVARAFVVSCGAQDALAGRGAGQPPGWIGDTQCTGFAGDVRAWLLVLPGGDARTRPRSHTSIYVYFGSVRPILEGWAATRAHLREITAAALDPLRGWPRRNASCSARRPIAASTGAPSAVAPNSIEVVSIFTNPASWCA
jgi:hypothetical protein